MRKQNKKIAGELPAINFDLIPLPCLNETFTAMTNKPAEGGIKRRRNIISISM